MHGPAQLRVSKLVPFTAALKTRNKLRKCGLKMHQREAESHRRNVSLSSRMSLDHQCSVEQHHRFTDPGLEHLPNVFRLGFYHLLVLNLWNSFRSPLLNLTPSPPGPHKHPREARTLSTALQLHFWGLKPKENATLPSSPPPTPR